MTFASVTDALLRYEDVLRRQGLGHDHFANGVTERDIAEIEDEVGFPFSEDVRAVWSWHNGAVRRPGLSGYETAAIVPSHPFLDLRAAAASGERSVDSARLYFDLHHEFIPLHEREDVTPGQNRFVTLCDGADAFHIETTRPEEADSLTFREVWGRGIGSIPWVTVTERVNAWIDAFDAGVWFVDDRGIIRQIDEWSRAGADSVLTGDDAALARLYALLNHSPSV